MSSYRMIYNLVIVRDTSGDVAMDTTFYLRPPVLYDFGVGLSYVLHTAINRADFVSW